MRISILLAIAALLAPIAAHAAKPASYAISIRGTVDLTSTNETDGVSEGGACMFHNVWKGHDTLTYASDHAVVGTLTSKGGSVRIPVRYQYEVNGWRDSVTTSGTCPNGAPLFPDHAPGCHTYSGIFVVKVEVTSATVAVSSVIKPFAGDGLCPGSRSLGVMLSKGKIDLAKLASRTVTTVSGSGPAPSVRLAPGAEVKSAFTVRLKRK